MSKIVSKSLDVAGRTLSFEIGRLAQQATSAVIARYGDSVVFASVVMGKEDPTKDYFPLQVEYQERLYAGGRIKGSRWVKRERNTDEEALSARLIDRSIRPLFPKTFKNEVQIIVMVLSTDTDNDTDVLAVNAVSAALAVSPIPWRGPVGSVRLGFEEEKLVVNPKNGNREGVSLDLVVSSTADLVPMIEAGANQVSEETFIQAIKLAMEQNSQTVKAINELVAEVGQAKIVVKPSDMDKIFVAEMQNKAKPVIEEALAKASGKEGEGLSEVVSTLSAGLEDRSRTAWVAQIVEEVAAKIVRQNLLEKQKRLDGRKLDEIRPLSAEVQVLPRVHGSAIIQRGQTQSLTVATVGAPSLGQTLETAEGESIHRYMHHYNFPPFSTGQTGRIGAPKRREIGHGALAERALAPVIPDEKDFPYAIRVVSEIMSSNGSTSMASTCGSTLALMDAGVPIKSPVAGISIGLVTDENYPKADSKYLLLTDIIGLEDHYTDMDFKIAGTATGVTAIQLDTKVDGLTLEIIEEAFKRAKVSRQQILEVIAKTIPEPRKELSPYAPKIHVVTIPVDKIGELIGPGGKVIRKLMAETSTVIDVNDDGSVFVSGSDQAGVDQAIGWIGSLGQEAKPGEIYEGTVARIQPFGAFVNILPGKDGLVHVSQMAEGFVSDPSQLVHEGDKVKVWVTEIDSQGRINLSMLFDAEGKPVVKAREERRPAGPRFEDQRGGPFSSAPRRGGFDRGGSRGGPGGPRRDTRPRY
ncbi:MAG: polyribonucleotide nucleotidyltransferase [bacterium]|nr:polyribonucleotide nucleotidyltransferase [bacterium]